MNKMKLFFKISIALLLCLLWVMGWLWLDVELCITMLLSTVLTLLISQFLKRKALWTVLASVISSVISLFFLPKHLFAILIFLLPAIVFSLCTLGIYMLIDLFRINLKLSTVLSSVILLIIISGSIFLVTHPLHPHYATKKLVGKTPEEVTKIYGEFDKEERTEFYYAITDVYEDPIFLKPYKKYIVCHTSDGIITKVYKDERISY